MNLRNFFLFVLPGVLVTLSLSLFFVNSSKAKEIPALDINIKRTAQLVDEVTATNIEDVIGKIVAFNAQSKTEPIFILMNSPGGDVLEMNRLIATIEGSDAPVYTINYGLCASACAMIHQYGDKRYATKRSTLMFHPMGLGMQGKLPEVASRMKYFERINDILSTEIAKRAGMTKDAFQQLFRDELWIDADQAKAKGFVDEIIKLGIDTSKLNE